MRKNKTNKIVITVVLIVMSSLVFSGCKTRENATVGSNENATGNPKETTPKVTIEPTAEAPPETVPELLYGEMSDDFYLIIEDTFELTGRDDLVVVGKSHNSPLYPGAEVDILSPSGRVQTTIGQIEVYTKLMSDGIPEETDAGLMLTGLTKQQVSRGDIIVLRGTGVISDKVDATVALLETINKEELSGILTGQSVWIKLFDTSVEAVIESVIQPEGANDLQAGDVVVLSLSITENIAYVDNQMFLLCNAIGTGIGAGYLFIPEEDNGGDGINVIIYEDESQKDVSYGQLDFNISPYHIENIVEDKDIKTFICKLDSDTQWSKDRLNIKIQSCSELDVKTLDEAKEYFSEFTSFNQLKSYQNIKDESGITTMYAAINEDESYYLVYCNDESYLIESDDTGLAYNLIEDSHDFLRNTFEKQTIECAKNKTVEIVADILNQDGVANYELFTDEGRTNYKAVLNIENDGSYLYSFVLNNSKGNEIQPLEWESTAESYPEFLDVNRDGYVDMKVIGEQGTSYDSYYIYIWNIELQRYEKVICDEILSEFEVHDGYLLNWIRDREGYSIQTLIWDGNKLIRDSEEYVEPDED